MRKMKRKDLYIFLIGVFLFLGIGYAFLTTDLSINGTATMVSNSWNIHFDHLVVKNGSVEIGTGDTAATITSPTTITFAVTLAQPGDYYEFSVDIVNDGTLPGSISSFDISPATITNSNIFGYQYSYTNGKQVKAGDIVDPNSFKTINFKVFYKDDIDASDLPSTNVQQVITVGASFEQADHIEKRVCTYNGELVPGAEFVDGQYTYHYMQAWHYDPAEYNPFLWDDLYDVDGWGVRLTDLDSTDPVITPLCGVINGKPIVSMSGMFAYSQASSIDLSSFYTGDVVDMGWMFSFSEATSLDLSSFDTSQVTNMLSMFDRSKATSINLSSFDTHNVEGMRAMFLASEVISLDLTHFDTSRVHDMMYMFGSTKVQTLDLRSFDTSNVLYMDGMFVDAEATTGIAGTQADADRFNATSEKPSTLVFVSIIPY